MLHLQQRHYFTENLKNVVENVLDTHSNLKHSANSEQVKLCGRRVTTDMRGSSKELTGKQEKARDCQVLHSRGFLCSVSTNMDPFLRLLNKDK